MKITKLLAPVMCSQFPAEGGDAKLVASNIAISGGIFDGAVSVDIYADHGLYGYNLLAVTLAGSLNDITPLLTAESSVEVESWMNDALPSWEEIQEAKRTQPKRQAFMQEAFHV